MSTLTQALQAEAEALERRYVYRVDEILGQLSEEDRAAVLQALQTKPDSKGYLAHDRISAVLSRNGYRVSASAVRNWRRKD